MAPEENVAIVRRMTEGVRSFWAGESSWMEAVGRFFDRDIDYYPVRKWPESRPCHGLEDLDRFFGAMSEGWGGMDWEVLAIEPVGDDRVLSSVNLRGAGRGSGLEISGDVYFCYWLRGGRIFRQEDHLTEAGARRGLGLGE
jgi:hypothetical protein